MLKSKVFFVFFGGGSEQISALFPGWYHFNVFTAIPQRIKRRILERRQPTQGLVPIYVPDF